MIVFFESVQMHFQKVDYVHLLKPLDFFQQHLLLLTKTINRVLMFKFNDHAYYKFLIWDKTNLLVELTLYLILFLSLLQCFCTLSRYFDILFFIYGTKQFMIRSLFSTIICFNLPLYIAILFQVVHLRYCWRDYLPVFASPTSITRIDNHLLHQTYSVFILSIRGQAWQFTWDLYTCYFGNPCQLMQESWSSSHPLYQYTSCLNSKKT